MPRLLMFGAFEKVIIGNDGLISLIGMLQNITIGIPQNQPALQKGPVDLTKAITQSQWTIFTCWHKEPSDGDIAFEERCALIGPDGKTRLEATTEFVMSKPAHRIINRIEYMPVWPPGEFTLKMWLRKKGEAEWSHHQADYPITIIHEHDVSASLNPTPTNV